MNATKIDTLRVPAASLYYEVRGRGPVLLLIGAGAADAASFNGIATHLADHYTVVSYDRRGYSRSPLDDPQEEQRLETYSDDAHRLFAVLSTEPVYVFGSSGGAKIGLDLAIRHPEQLQTLVAHEPPVDENSSPRSISSNARTNYCVVGADRSWLEPGSNTLRVEWQAQRASAASPTTAFSWFWSGDMFLRKLNAD